MRIFRSSMKPWIEGKGYSKRPLVTEDELEAPGTLVQEVEFKPGQSVPPHRHMHTREVFIALDHAVFQVNSQEVKMEPMDVLLCEPGDIHGNPAIERSFRILVIKLDNKEDDTIWL
ncbi:MAG: cupin domain-containing protein [Methanomassiliicoccales archaeon]|jgi:quercetin dioxygenase-like cupin family protein|nr:cupin domain-containing protein [Methanomassiliicoccales archaeon]MDD1755225.1 cupin domain-containing protein [Methanomassiliicoccales archaeon]